MLPHLELRLHISQLLLGLRSLTISMAQLNLHFIQVSFHLLLDSQGIVPAPDLRIQSALHGVSHPLAVPFDLLNFLILLRQLPVYLTLNLVELQLDAKDLGLFVFQSSLKRQVFIKDCLQVCILKVALTLSKMISKSTSASSRAVWISVFSVSTCFLAFSSSWMLLPVSPICSVRSEISSTTTYVYICIQTSISEYILGQIYIYTIDIQLFLGHGN